MPVSDAKKRANARWNASKDNIMIRPDKEEGATIRNAAAVAGQSNQQYILQAVRERMARDAAAQVSESHTGGPQAHSGAGVVSLPSGTLERAQEAAQHTGESVSRFVERAVNAYLDGRE